MVLYSTESCPRCKILKQKLTDNNIEFEECHDMEILESLNIEEVPQLLVNDELLSFGEAVKYINNKL